MNARVTGSREDYIAFEQLTPGEPGAMLKERKDLFSAHHHAGGVRLRFAVDLQYAGGVGLEADGSLQLTLHQARALAALLIAA